MTTPLSQDHFDQVIEGLRRSVATKTDVVAVEERLGDRLDGQRAEFKEDIRDVLGYVRQVGTTQGERFDRVDAKLEAVMEMLATRKQLEKLVRALKQQGIKLEEGEIFAA